MRRIRRFLVLTLLICLGTMMPGIKSYAEEMSGEQTSAESGLEDENPQRMDTVTAMDEDGNIFEVDEEGGEVDDPGIAAFSRDASVKVVNFRTKGNAVTEYKESQTGVAGYTNGAYGADAAYLGTVGTNKVRFMLSGVVGEVAADEVQVVDFTSAESVSYYAVEGGRLRHYITQDMTKADHATSLDNGNAPSYLQEGIEYYSYDGHYFYTDYGTMLTDYQNGARSASVNPGNPYYNYYQYLPFRSRTSYSGAELNSLIGARTNGTSKLNNTGDYFVGSQNQYGVNALIMVGIGANESGWGTSSICQSKNNLFGLNAVDSSPGTSANTYASVEECIRQFADGWMSRKYLNPKNWVYNGGFLGNKASGVNVKYASDPYWGEKAANIIWGLDQNGGSRDANAYTIGIKDTLATGHTSVNVRSQSNQSAASLYKTDTPSNYAVLIQDQNLENGYYRIQSDAVLNSERSGVNTGSGEYDFEQMYAYMHSDYVTIVNQGQNVTAKKELQSVTISQAPAKTEYIAGEVFDPSGMVVTAGWNDGTQEDVTGAVSYNQEPLQSGMESITVSYTYEEITKSAEQAVTVTDSAASPTPGTDNVPGTDSGTTGGTAPTPTPDTTPGADSEPLPTPDSTPGTEVEPSPTPDSTPGTEVEPSPTPDSTLGTEVEPSPTPNPTPGADGTTGSATNPSPTPDPVPGTDSEPSPTPDSATGTEDSPTSNLAPGTEGTPDANVTQTEKPEAVPTSVVKNESTGIWIRGGINNGAECKVQTIAKDSEQYRSYIEPVKDRVVLGVYDIELTTKLAEGESVELGIPVGEQYNGKRAVVLHYDNSKGMEKFTPVVENGQVVVTVSGFSPYVVALDEAGNESVSNERKAPKTGDESRIVMWGVFLALSLFAIFYLWLFRKRRYMKS